MSEILLKIHKSYRWVVAICDKDLLGKKFVEGKRQLDLSGEFFKGKEFSEIDVTKEVVRLVGEDATFNIIGKNSIRVAKEVGIVKDEGVMEVCGIPFALILL